MPLDEQALFNKRPQTRSTQYQCPKCQRIGSYNVQWVLHSKKSKLPPGANRDDREKFDKLRDYLVRLDDHVTCTTCGKKFEISSQHSMIFAEQFSGLPNEEELEKAKQGTRQQIAFYGSTPAYRGVLECHGWGDMQTELNSLSKEGKWVEMGHLVDDEILDAFAVVGEPEQIAEEM